MRGRTGRRTRRTAVGALLLAASAMVGAAASPSVGAGRGAPLPVPPAGDSLPAWLATAVGGNLERAHWGVAVYDLATGRPLLLHNADRFFVPASALKLVVTATAVERLGPGFAYRTSVYGTRPVTADGTLEGDLVLYGRGDPNLSGRYAPSMTAIFEALADSLAADGLRRVAGDLVADESHWDGDHLHGDWSAYDLLWWYAAPVGALGFNDNSIDFHVRPAGAPGAPPIIETAPVSAFYALENRATTGPPGGAGTFDLTREPGTNRITAYGVLPLDADPTVEYFAVVDPAAYAGAVFREVLERRGIAVSGRVREVSDPSSSAVAQGDTVPLAAHVSPPLERVLASINGRSQNWHAEQLLKTIGRRVRGEGSWRAGLAVERETLAAIGIDTTAFRLRDGSGLSSSNLATPRALARLLLEMRRRPNGDLYAASLPVAGASGSLRRRFVGTAAEGRVQAKTGYIENVYALAGYLTTVDGRQRAFSVVVNGAVEDAAPAIDRFVLSLVGSGDT